MKNAVIILFLILFSNIYAQKSKPSPSKWNDNGKAEVNFPKENFQYFSKGKVYYYVSNDKENIYLDMRIDDPQTQNKILKQGLTVWINDDNKQGKTCGVRFPIGSENPVRSGRQFQQGPSQATGINPNSPIAQANTIELMGFTKAERRIIPSNNGDNLRGWVRYDNEGVLIYKMIIPVSRIETDKNIGTEPISLGIEPGSQALKRPGGPQTGTPAEDFSSPLSGGGGRSGRSGGGGGGGRPSGGMGGGGFSGGGAPPVQPGSQSVILWIKDITLAAEK
jgi:hypothetical protein